MSAVEAVEIGLPEALERAASALPAQADAIRPANGDPGQLARTLEGDDARTVLAWLLEHEPAAGGELALAWAEDAETAAPVLALAPASLPKPARKALRRALHRLRSRGVAVPEAPAPATVAKLPPMDEAIDEARITALDPHGVRLAYLAVDRPGGGVRLFEVAFDEAAGILELEIFDAGRGRARRFLRETGQRTPWPAVAAPSASVRALLARAATQQRADRATPRAWGEWSSRLCNAPADTPTPGALASAALGPVDAGDRAALDTVADWVRTGELGPWPPPVERMKALVERLDEIAKGVVIVSDAARAERIDAVLRDGLGEVYDEDQRERVARALEETAYVWWRSAREPDARIALAGAGAWRARAPAENPIARALLETLLRPALERARAEGEGAPAEPPPDSESG